MRLNNNVQLLGRLTADPELKTTPTGLEVVQFTVAIDRPKAKDATEKQTDFIPCVAWRKTAVFVDKYFSKGKLIHVGGSLRSRKYEDKNGNKRTAYEVVVSEVGFVGSKAESEPSGGPAPIPPAADVSVTVDEDDLPF